MNFIISLLALFTECFALHCKNDQGRNVDWIFIYKLPSSSGAPKGGYSYAYTTDKMKDFVLSAKGIDEKNSVLGKILSSIYNNDNKFTYLFYNDDPPHKEASSNRAHSKGILIAEKHKGIFLTHSVPNFPSLNESYTYPATATSYGQVIFCFTFLIKEVLDSLLKMLLFIKPNIYNYFFQNELKNNYPNLELLENKKWTKNLKLPLLIETYEKQPIEIFAKSDKQEQDVYSDLLSDYYQTALFVQTWRRGAGTNLKNSCKLNFSTFNLIKIGINTKNNDKLADWLYLNDHSKWALSLDANVSLACIGDMNRMKSQSKRGGAFLCLKNPELWQELKKSIKEYEKC